MSKQHQQQRRTAKPSQKILASPVSQAKRPTRRRSSVPSQASGMGPFMDSSRKSRSEQAFDRSEVMGVSYGRSFRSRPPRITQKRHDTKLVCHRELIATVAGTNSTAFTIGTTFVVNPGLQASFPFLSTEAVNWEEYQFRKLRFIYETRCSTATVGTVVLAPDYDASDPAPISDVAAESYSDAVASSPYKLFSTDLERVSQVGLGPRKLVRTAALSANQDIKLYDAANVYICTVDSAAAGVWGRVYVEYECEFWTPQLPPAGGSLQNELHITGATPTTASILGTQTIVSGSTSLASVAGDVLTFNSAGEFFVLYEVTSTTSDTFTNLINGAGLVFVTTFQSGGYGTAGDVTANFAEFALVKTPVGGTLTFNNVIILGLTAELYISQVPYNSA